MAPSVDMYSRPLAQGEKRVSEREERKVYAEQSSSVI
jgi:hypothetical protein